MEAMLKRADHGENHTIRNIFLLLCGAFLLTLSLLLYQTFKPHYYNNNESDEYRVRNIYVETEKPPILTIKEEDEIAGNEIDADKKLWDPDLQYYGDDLLSLTDDELHRYRIHTSARTWFDAVTTCWNEGGHLATPRDNEEAKVLGRILKAAMSTVTFTNTQMKIAMHVGVNNFVTNTWTTLDGEVVDNVLWLRKQFRSGFQSFDYRCSAIVINGRLSTQLCDEKLIYACDMKQQNRSIEESTYQPITSDGYEAIGEQNRYRIHESWMSWFEALEVCEKEGGHLMSPRLGDQTDLLIKWFSTHLPESVINDGILIGINSIEENGTWYDAEGRYFSTRGEGIPISVPDKNCAILLPNASLDIISCNEPKPFICEKKITENVREKIEYEAVEGLGRYALHTIPQNWGAAVLQCFFENATLAVPDSLREAKMLEEMYRNCKTCERPFLTDSWLWVAINDLDNDKIWRKLTGERIYGSGFNEWFPLTQSQSYMRCGALRNGTFTNANCDYKNAFICKKSL